jgi:hypothetical protein
MAKPLIAFNLRAKGAGSGSLASKSGVTVVMISQRLWTIAVAHHSLSQEHFLTLSFQIFKIVLFILISKHPDIFELYTCSAANISWKHYWKTACTPP